MELNDLQKGTIYTNEQIASIVNSKKDALILSEDTSVFRKGDSSRYLVMNKIESFIHQNDEGSYCVPNSKQLIYIVKKCS